MRHLSVVFLLAALTLACAGGEGAVTVAPDAGTPYPAPGGGHLVQDVDGLYAADGVLVAPIPGEWDLRDVYVIDAARESFFLLSTDDVVRVARRSGGELVVSEITTGARVVRPIGQVAAIRRGAEPTLTVIDAGGAALIEGVVPAPAADGTPDPPLAWPEYWWAPSWSERPAAFCHATPTGEADPARCGWIGPTGAWLAGSADKAVTPFLTGWAEATNAEGASRWVDPSGATFPSPDAVAWHGPPSEGLALIRRDEESPVEVVDASGASQGKADSSVVVEVDGRGCTDPTATCRYRFHEDRAPVWTYADGVWGAAYLGPDGRFAVPPAACTAPILSGPFHDGRAFRCKGDEYWMIDPSGREIAGPYRAWEADPSHPSPNTYPSGLFFSDGLAAVPTDGGWAYVDTAGEVVLAGPYEIARPFRVGLAVVKQGGAVRYIRKDGSTALDPAPGG